MGTRGGKQPGAGRPKGSLTTKTQELIARAASEGIMPMDVLLGDMRLYHQIGEQKVAEARLAQTEGEKEKAMREAAAAKSIARECAESVSPYIHPKLSSMQANVNVSNVEAELAELE